MIKVNDKIGFRRTEYGKMEFGTYRGYADGKYTVELEDGEMVEMTTESYSGSRWCTKSPMSGMVHHIGWLVAKRISSTVTEVMSARRGMRISR